MASVKLELQPFPVPTEVTVKMPPAKREDGIKPGIKLALVDLDDATLEALIDEFVAGVMAVARPEK
jgi:hypothetical protein